MKVIIAEKPSVAREIAAIVGAKEKQEGYIQGNGYAVTWALGHLVSLAMPEEYGAIGFSREHLPITPEPFKLKVRQVKADKGYKADTGAVKQLGVIKKLFEQCDSIIVATDAGREGELIFRYIYHYLECNKPFDRLWINSLTDKAIREGLANLKDGSEYDNLYLAAKARSEADWLVGINASQALSVAAGYGTYSLGRVQTPTLMMICNRYQENKGFTPQTYVQMLLTLKHSDSPLFTTLSTEKFKTITEADPISERIYNGGVAKVISVDEKPLTEQAPLLYDLTALQKEANKRFGYTAQETLDIAQALYEKKFITYPRTGSRYIPNDVFAEIPNLISGLNNHPAFGNQATMLLETTLNQRSVDDSKVTDHHALLITDNKPSELSNKEKDIYTLIAARLLEAFSSACQKNVTTVVFDAREYEFIAKSTIITNLGWRGVLVGSDEKNDDNEEQACKLPPLQQGDECEIQSLELLEKQTKPKPMHTESSLLSAMESAGKELENEEERQAMKESGIGTPATRAAIIETLFARDYIRRDKKTLLPTEKGLSVYAVVKSKKIADIQMTGMWENALSKIENGEMSAETFGKGITVYASQVTEELLNTSITVAEKSTCCCPKCGKPDMLFFDKVVKCRNVECSVTVFRERSGKQLSDKHITELLTKRKTATIKGFKSKAGKSFDAALAFDEQFNVVFLFPDKKKR